MLVGERRTHASPADRIQTAVVVDLPGADAGLSLAPLLEHWARLRFFPVDPEMMALVRYADRAFGSASGGSALGGTALGGTALGGTALGGTALGGTASGGSPSGEARA